MEISQQLDFNRTDEMQGEKVGPRHGIVAYPTHAIAASQQPSSDRMAGAFRGEFPFKNRCSSLPFLTFDRFVKK